MNVIFQINGGLGKSVMATSVCKSIKEKYPDSQLIVITGYPDVFLNNPYVDRCMRHGELRYFYKDYVDGHDFIFLGHEPYLENSYIKREKHLVETWCDLFDVPFLQTHGEIYLSKREVDFYIRKYQFDKPVLMLQTSGSAGDLMYNWTRDMSPKLVYSIIKKYEKDYDIVHVRSDNQLSYEGTISFTDNIRAVAVLMSVSSKRIFMDSCCQHIAAAMGLKSNVFWVTTSPKIFGYDSHNNILANPETKNVSLPSSFLSKYDFVGNLTDFPYNDEGEIFSENVLDDLK